VRIEGSIEIHRPVEEVFDFVSDQRNEPLYNPEMTSSEKVTDGPIGVGTRFRATTQSRGRPLEMVIEVTGLERPRRMDSTTHLSSMDLDGGLTFQPSPGGTQLRWTWNLRPRGVLGLLGPLVGAVGRRNERRIWDGLKRHLEAQAP
jgi:carbon monoxide dehydrogenase subunit G